MKDELKSDYGSLFILHPSSFILHEKGRVNGIGSAIIIIIIFFFFYFSSGQSAAG
jgi:hypothetical protein